MPGEGYSSPIIEQSQVIVTSSAPTDRSTGVRLVESWVVCALLTALASVAAVTSIQPNLNAARQSWSRKELLWKCVQATALTGSFFIVFFSDSLLDYDRCSVRKWLGSAFCATSVLTLALFCIPAKNKMQIWLGICLVATGIGQLIFIPEKEHAFRGGLAGSPITLVFIAASFPITLGIFVVMKWVLSAYLWEKAARWCLGALTLAFSVIFGLFLLHAVRTWSNPSAIGGGHRGDSTLAFKPFVSAPLYSFLIWGGIFSSAGIALLHAMQRRSDKSALNQRLLANRVHSPVSGVWCHAICAQLAAVIALISGLIALDAAVRFFPYLNYHLGGPQWNPLLGWKGFAICAAIVEMIFLSHLFGIAPVIPFPGGSWTTVGAITLAVFLILRGGRLTEQVGISRIVCSYDLSSGKPLWTWKGFNGPRGQLDKRNSPATPTPLACQGRVFAHFGNGGLVCLDFNGTERWRRLDLRSSEFYGAASSLVAAENTVIVSLVKHGKIIISGINCDSGETVWRHAQALRRGGITGVSRTPLIVTLHGAPTVLILDDQTLTGFNVTSGKTCFSLPMGFEGGDCVSSLVANEEIVIATDANRTVAISLAGLEAGKLDLKWQITGKGVNCASPLLVGDRLFLISDFGVLACIDCITGKRIYRTRLEGEFYASPIAIGDICYFTNTAGITFVLPVFGDGKAMSRNELPGEIRASFAMDGREAMVIRTLSQLYVVSVR